MFDFPARPQPRVKSDLPSGFVKTPEEIDYRTTPPIFAGLVRLLRWANSSASGMTASLALERPEEFVKHPFKGLMVAKDAEKLAGQRLQVAVSLPAIEHEGDQDAAAVYTGEAILLWWSDDCKDGMKFTIRMRNGPDGAGVSHPMDGMPHGRRNGEVLYIAAWALADDEGVTDPRAERKRRTFGEMTPTMQSQILCRDRRFYEWLNMRLPDLFPETDAREELLKLQDDEAAFCGACVKLWCGIASRADFKEDSENGERARSRWADILSSFEDHVWSRPPT